MRQIGNHPRVGEYDGAFHCYACDALWGAVTGHPPMPEKCERKERRKRDRRTPEPSGEFVRVRRDAVKVAIELLEYAEDVPQRHTQASALSLYFEQQLAAAATDEQKG